MPGGWYYHQEVFHPPRPWHDIELRFFVVGEQSIWRQTMAGSGASRYKVILRPNAMERVKERLSRSDIWGLKKRGREEWKVEVQFHNRTHSFFDGNRPRRYNRGEFDAVVIFYDPRSPRKTFELVWTKVCPGVVLHENCSKIIGH
jgi:hypothetical protein